MVHDDKPGRMRELALFAGAGGGILGGILLGWDCVCAVEIEPYCRKVLLARQRDGILPAFPLWDDVRTFDGRPWRGKVDVISGGFPCTDISVSGKGRGIEGKHSGLWREMARIVSEVRPRFVFVENSPMLVRRGLAMVLGDLAAMGYDARWCVLGADNAGSPHKRTRFWLVAHSDPVGLSEDRARTDCAILDGQAPRVRGKRHRTPAVSTPGGDPVWLRRIRTDGKGSTPWNAIREPGRTTKRGVDGVVDGMADDVDRLAALGNGQVPAVVRLAWNTMTDPSWYPDSP